MGHGRSSATAKQGIKRNATKQQVGFLNERDENFLQQLKDPQTAFDKGFRDTLLWRDSYEAAVAAAPRAKGYQQTETPQSRADRLAKEDEAVKAWADTRSEWLQNMTAWEISHAFRGGGQWISNEAIRYMQDKYAKDRR